MGAVSSVVNVVVDAVSDVADFVVDEIVEPVVDTVETIVENPVALASVALSIAAPGVGTAIGSALGASGAAATALGNAVIGGTLSEASGGDFAKGALTAGATSLVAPVIGSTIGNITDSQAITNALTSGTLSELQGGNFAQGAITGGVVGGLTDLQRSLAEDYLNSLPGGYDLANNPAPTEADVLNLIASENPSASDYYNFSADYSLGSDIAGSPGLKITPLGTQYNVGDFNYSLGDLLDSLGLKSQNTTNIDAMGGGQGIILKTIDGYITENGFVPNSYVSSLGDPESFINKPVIDTNLSLDDLSNASPDEITNKIAALDVAKALTPYALSMLTGAALNIASNQADQGGFAIIPYSKDWKSPTYNMAFTPSEPINFGTRDLLNGTQWENPLDLSSVINTINSQQTFSNPAPEYLTQFNQPYNVGVNDIIGNLQGSPVSISDIISGIQSQYG